MFLTGNTFSLYNLATTGNITFADKTNPCVITSPNHGLSTGNLIMISQVGGMVNLNNNAYTITKIDDNNFSLNGVDATGFPLYTSGGIWALSVNSTAYQPILQGEHGQLPSRIITISPLRFLPIRDS